ncbi:hypothetical protein BCV71DRAFT_277784 [Rhizopus microsporus]|uniref:Uncharacterized protein n=1 Tax=Rhizopus microsporus TaxID=58291 RepID=A0A1X0RNP5_RHIZD|nr:hypothetical protein BCV71DRAFT_277784 [Rhizopus microsporus]
MYSLCSNVKKPLQSALFSKSLYGTCFSFWERFRYRWAVRGFISSFFTDRIILSLTSAFFSVRFINVSLVLSLQSL